MRLQKKKLLTLFFFCQNLLQNWDKFDVLAILHPLTTTHYKSMKKHITIAVLLALGASFANAATELTYWGEDNNKDLCTIEGTALPYLGLGNARAPEDVLVSIKSEGNTDYSLNFKDENQEPVSFIVNDALYFDQIYTSGNVTSYSITFGAEGSLTAATKYDQWGGAIRFTQGAKVEISAVVSEAQQVDLAVGDVFTRTLIASTDTTHNGLWNVTDYLTFEVTGLDGDYTNVGKVSDISQLRAGEYGYMVDGGDSVSLVFSKIPEPSAFGLLAGLGALALVASRRRRK